MNFYSILPFLASLFLSFQLQAQSVAPPYPKPQQGKVRVSVKPKTSAIPAQSLQSGGAVKNTTTPAVENTTETPSVESVTACGENKIVLIKQALHWAGYYDSSNYSNVLDAATRQSLTRYQQDHSLPVGNLNMDTLRELDRYLRKHQQCSMLK